VFEAHGLDFDTLQSPQSRAWLGLAEGELPPEMKIAFPDGSTLGGAIAIAYMLRKVWWMAWIGWLIPAPGIRWVSERVYRWLARNRGCLGDLCANRSRLAGLRRHHGATTFLEGP
jgi:predicted DCC family thiol-disulfide oxidoreductase YuxK